MKVATGLDRISEEEISAQVGLIRGFIFHDIHFKLDGLLEDDSVAVVDAGFIWGGGLSYLDVLDGGLLNAGGREQRRGGTC